MVKSVIVNLLIKIIYYVKMQGMIFMKIGVVGLGLIGGSLAKAYTQHGHEVYGYDIDETILSFAKMARAITGVLDSRTLEGCDAVFIALYPKDTVAWLEYAASHIAKNALVFDCCGVKRVVCGRCFEVAAEHGFTFVGGHPMAGSHKGGFKNSGAELFKGASMILVPPVYDDPVLFGRIEEVLKPVGFGHLTVTIAEKHDEMIAFSSQMAHVVSNAFVKSPAAKGHKGFSAGSYKDLTRVAQLNADMWTELFIQNNDYLINELDVFIAALTLYRNALLAGDEMVMKRLLEDGSRIKRELDDKK
jgi:prephenate dehydrogenase